MRCDGKCRNCADHQRRDALCASTETQPLSGVLHCCVWRSAAIYRGTAQFNGGAKQLTLKAARCASLSWAIGDTRRFGRLPPPSGCRQLPRAHEICDKIANLRA